MSDSLAATLDGAARRSAPELLRLTREVARRLERFGAYTLRRDWSTATRDIALEVARRWPEARGRVEPDAHLESIAKNAFWGRILDLMTEEHAGVERLFFPTVRRLVARWDGARAHEASWDDVVQDTARQLWERWREGGVEKPWALLCIIAKRRYLDAVRAARPSEELDERLGEAPEAESGLFAEEALAVLEPEERRIVVWMDLEGRTRREVARELDRTEGQVLSIRRAGLRRIWRWLGGRLPPRERAVWNEMFKGAKRASPQEAAKKLDLPLEDLLEILRRARQLAGVDPL